MPYVPKFKKLVEMNEDEFGVVWDDTAQHTVTDSMFLTSCLMFRAARSQATAVAEQAVANSATAQAAQDQVEIMRQQMKLLEDQVSALQAHAATATELTTAGQGQAAAAQVMAETSKLQLGVAEKLAVTVGTQATTAQDQLSAFREFHDTTLRVSKWALAVSLGALIVSIVAFKVPTAQMPLAVVVGSTPVQRPETTASASLPQPSRTPTPLAKPSFAPEADGIPVD